MYLDKKSNKILTDVQLEVQFVKTKEIQETFFSMMKEISTKYGEMRRTF